MHFRTGAFSCISTALRLTIILLSTSFFLSPLHAQTKPPYPHQPIGAQAYILEDVDTGRILAQHNAHQRMFPASLTKTMTALVAIEKGDLNKVVRIGPNPPKTGESSVNLLEGETFTLADLVRAALIHSANDACVAIAEAVAGNVPSFVKMMNVKAEEIGAKQTHFANPHGLHDPNHYTTPYDLALIVRRAMTHSFFNEVVATKEYTLHGNYKIGPRRVMYNRNRLLFRWPSCDGVKTGYTRQAGRCLIASATLRDAKSKRPWRLLAVVMKAPNSWSDGYNLLKFHGFNQFQPVLVARADERVAQANVVGGAHSVAAVADHDVELPLRPYEKAHVTAQPHLARVLAPVVQGERVGRVEYWFKDHKLGEVPLVARADVPASLVAHALPGAAALVPTEPLRRYGLYALAAAILVTLTVAALTFLKAISNARTQRARRIVAYRPEKTAAQKKAGR
jgi:D-alanyl-D-alanine carboxypeptidase (penicillin-binding protein 5/6)